MQHQKKNKCNRCYTILHPNKAKCHSCGFWNTVDEEKVALAAAIDDSILLSDVSTIDDERIIINIGDSDKCFGGGLAKRSVTLLGGKPGAGKSTFGLQLADSIGGYAKKEVLYVGAEEHQKDIRTRAERLKLKNQNYIRLRPLGSSTVLDYYFNTYKHNTIACIIDSLQGFTLDLQEQLEFCHHVKNDLASIYEIPIIIICQVNKDGDLSGLNALQHAVDTVQYIDVGDNDLRIMESGKNRFGPSGIQAFFDMTEQGLIYAPNLEEYIDADEETDKAFRIKDVIEEEEYENE